MKLRIAVLLAALACAQEMGRVEGRVVSSTGEPLPNALVQIRKAPSPDAVRESAAPTDYQIRVTLDGYAQENAGQGLRLIAGETAKPVIRMFRSGSISGRVTGPEGEPVAGASVRAYQRLQLPAAEGLPFIIAEANSAETMETGEFRIGKLRPGRYYIEVTPSGYMSDEEGALIPALYPGTPYFNDALKVTVLEGAEAPGIDIRLRDDPRYAVRGRVTVPEGYSAADLTLQLLPRGESVANSNSQVVPMPDGTFEFPGFYPGEYSLRTFMAVPTERRVDGEMTVRIGRADLEGVELRVMPPVRIAGLALLEDGQPLEAAELPTAYLGNVNAKIGPLGDFQLNHVPALKHKLALRGLPPGHYLKAARFGGQDVLGTPLDLTFGSGGRLEFTISNQAAVISGVARDDKGQPAALGWVFVWNDAGLQQLMRLNSSGEFRIDNLAPGRYHFLALEDASGSYGLPESRLFREAFAEEVEPVNATEGAHEHVELKIVKSDRIAREAAKFP